MSNSRSNLILRRKGTVIGLRAFLIKLIYPDIFPLTLLMFLNLQMDSYENNFIIYHSNTTLLLGVKSVLHRLLIVPQYLKFSLLIFSTSNVIRNVTLDQDSVSGSWREITIISISVAGAPSCAGLSSGSHGMKNGNSGASTISFTAICLQSRVDPWVLQTIWREPCRALYWSISKFLS